MRRVSPVSVSVFQFTPLREGRQVVNRAVEASADFNSRPSARGDDRAAADVRRSVYFNSRPSARGDSARTPGRSREPISIHAPPRGATVLASYWESLKEFQFTPLREGRQRGEAFPSPDDVISIHAPPRGATPRKFQLKKTQRISIHAPPRGATATLTPFRTRRRNFNSRPSARGDQRFRHRAGGRDISIHAPPRGATARERRGRNAPHNFNSRPSARGDG